MAGVLTDNGPQTALALAVLAAAWSGRHWRGSGLSAAAALLALAVSFLLLWRMRQAGLRGGENLFTIVIAYLLPALLLTGAARLLGGGAPMAARIVKAARDLAWILALAAAVLVLNGLAPGIDGNRLLFTGLRLAIWLLVARTIDALARDPRAPPVARWLVLVPLLPALEPLAALLAGSANPVFSGEDVGLAPFVNALLVGYLLPAGLFARLAVRRPAGEPSALRWLFGPAAVLLALFWASLELRRAFHGAVLSGPAGEAERLAYLLLWSISAVAVAGWLWRRRRNRAERMARPDQLSS